MFQGLADAGGSGDGNSRKEQKSSHNGLPSHPHNQPKRSRTGTPTPAPKMPRIEPSRLAPVPITRVVTPPSHEPESEDQQPIVEVDPGDNPNVKSEGWMMASHGEDSSEYEIPPDQFEQDMQAEDEQYIQAGNDALTGQQVETVYDLLHSLLIRKWEFVGLELVSAAAHSFTIYELLITLLVCKLSNKFYLPRSDYAKIDGRDLIMQS